jgi:hypothetical protein
VLGGMLRYNLQEKRCHRVTPHVDMPVCQGCIEGSLQKQRSLLSHSQTAPFTGQHVSAIRRGTALRMPPLSKGAGIRMGSSVRTQICHKQGPPVGLTFKPPTMLLGPDHAASRTTPQKASAGASAGIQHGCADTHTPQRTTNKYTRGFECTRSFAAMLPTRSATSSLPSLAALPSCRLGHHEPTACINTRNTKQLVSVRQQYASETFTSCDQNYRAHPPLTLLSLHRHGARGPAVLRLGCLQLSAAQRSQHRPHSREQALR